VGELVAMVLASGITAGLFFCVFGTLADRGLDRYLEESSYLEEAEGDMVQELQDYVIENGIRTSDTTLLSSWVKKNSIVYLEIYRGDLLVYVSDKTENEDFYEDLEVPYYRESYYEVLFADGAAEVFLTGAFAYRYQMYVMVGEILASFLVFLVCFIWGVRKRISYIQELHQEIGIMEGGCLDHPILVKGKDELAELAEGLNQLRQSLKENIEKEQELRQENQNLIVGMAHDLRTPLTALTVYIQVMQSEVCDSQEEREYYLKKMMAKAVQMKELSDRLFECSQIGDRKKEEILEEPRLFQSVFEDCLSEMAMFLENQGYMVEADLEWKREKIRVRMDYIGRIVDNLGMNLVKYADAGEPVYLKTVYEKGMAGIEICNRVREFQEGIASTKIGLENVRAMMSDMGGSCEEETGGGIYRIRILFPEGEQQIK